jgi:hypothetical protein
VTTVRSALNDFYGSLNDEQKARFEAIGPKRTSQLGSLDVTHTPARRRGVDPVSQIVGRLTSIGAFRSISSDKFFRDRYFTLFAYLMSVKSLSFRPRNRRISGTVVSFPAASS